MEDEKYDDIIIGTDCRRIEAYDNKDNCTRNDKNFVIIYKNNKEFKTICTGLKWQCVEFARRWYVINKLYTFEDVPDAKSIWDFDEFTSVLESNKTQKIKKYENTKQNERVLEEGDIVIFEKTKKNDFYGHIAVISCVCNDNMGIRKLL